ncbi:MAG: GNAT family N-acetyltransferase [Alphaproteobacteria bacterium]
MEGVIRPARSDEADALTDLNMRSKAVWGYDRAFMEASRPVLTVTPALIDKFPVYVYEVGGRVLGCYALGLDGPAADIELFFVDPDHLREGIGRALWRHLESQARRLGVTKLRIESDPSAVGFYETMGARVVGSAPSDAIPGRSLPLLEIELAA